MARQPKQQKPQISQAEQIEQLSADEREGLNFVIKEIATELGNMDDAREQIKNIIDDASKQFNIEKPLIRKVSKLYYKQNMPVFENETSIVRELYRAIAKPNQP